MNDYSNFPFDQLTVAEIFALARESKDLGDYDFVTACMEAIRKRPKDGTTTKLIYNGHELKCFNDSPDAGDPACICSKCEQQIAEDIVPVRIFPEQGNIEVRMHPDCFYAVQKPIQDGPAIDAWIDPTIGEQPADPGSTPAGAAP